MLFVADYNNNNINKTEKNTQGKSIIKQIGRRCTKHKCVFSISKTNPPATAVIESLPTLSFVRGSKHSTVPYGKKKVDQQS